MSYIGNIPILTIPKSKYSSTETEYSSDDDGGTSYFEDHNGKLSLSGFSTSAASSSGSSRKRRKRRRNSTSSNSRWSSSSINLSHRSDRSGGSTSTRYNITPCTSIAENSQTEFCDVSCKRLRNVAALNSIYDLKHAIGRHRGISGSCAAIDAALFAMFYVTDIFDSLLTEDSNQHLRQGHDKLSVRKDISSLFRKEIVYSLRINYFCPASKVVKLRHLIEKQYSLHNIQDSGDFLDLLFRELLKSPSFFTYSDGSDGFIHLINLENYLARKYYYQPLALTVQSILRQLNVYPTRNVKDLNPTRGTSFSMIPYPALILKIVRKVNALNGTSTDNSSMYYWENSTETHHHHHKRPVIPNLKIDLTDLMTTRRNDDDHISNLQKSFSHNWDKSKVFNQSLTTSLGGLRKDFSYEPKIGVGVGRSESRFVKGMKSAWKTMYHYLEDLTVSSSNMIPPESGGRGDYTSHEINTQNDDKSLKQSTSLSSFSTLRSTRLNSRSNHDFRKELVSSSTIQKVKVKMELIAIICKSHRKNGISTDSEKNSNCFSGGYSVYCKAGKDNIEFAPWVLYLPRNGVAPQVQLIENFGTWIDSLERHHESFSLHKVPSEIRTVLEDSHLLIYKQVEK